MHLREEVRGPVSYDAGVTLDAFAILERTSRTFFIPIQRLPPRLREAVASAYLCMRAIDEIEDQRALPLDLRAELLRSISLAFQSAVDGFPARALGSAFQAAAPALPEVTRRLEEWVDLAPSDIRFRVCDSIAAMADRMAHWCERGFRIETEVDLDQYTYGVAGAVGLLLSDLWSWYDGTQTDRTLALGFGRGLQAVNILRNRDEDGALGVDFHPRGWGREEMMAYARKNLAVADRYTARLPAGPVRDFCAIPLALAHATLRALEAGRPKLTRAEVAELLAERGRG